MNYERLSLMEMYSEKGSDIMINTKVRLIKRNQKNTSGKDTQIPARRTPGELERELKATVSGWIHEFRQQRQSFDKHAFAGLFGEG